jgi:site-specific DNA-methyltransferase (adenine-specific)
VLPAVRRSVEEIDDGDFQARAVRQGQKAEDVAKAVLLRCGFTDVTENVRIGSGVEVNFTGRDQGGRLWCFDVSGAFSSPRPGLRRTDTVWKALGRAAILRLEFPSEPQPLILLSTNLPARGSAGFLALKRGRGEIFWDALEMLDDASQDRLREYARGDARGPIGDFLGPVDEERG